MKYAYLIIRIFAPAINLFTDFVNLFIRRDRKIILMGAWMGTKYADNTRFLFETLNEHKNKYGLKKVIWVARDSETIKLLKKSNYEVYKMHSIQSIYYHFRAGVNIICNISFPVKGYDGDIMGQLSGHSIKINTWHGIPIKAGKSTGKNIKKEGIVGTIKYCLRNNKMLMSLFTPGHWDKAFYLSTGKEATKRCSIFCGVDPKYFIEAGYPRDCKSNKLLESEQKIISFIENKGISLLYAPTFREKGDVPHPLSDNVIREFMEKEEILWIEKPHSAAKNTKISKGDYHNVLYLDSKFDINCIIPYVDLVITDYSSVCYDAIAYSKPVLYYAPDIDFYAENERGFLCDFRKMVKGYLSVNTEDLVNQMSRFIHDKEFKTELDEKVIEEKSFVLDKQPLICEDIISTINARIGLFE